MHFSTVPFAFSDFTYGRILELVVDFVTVSKNASFSAVSNPMERERLTCKGSVAPRLLIRELVILGTCVWRDAIKDDSLADSVGVGYPHTSQQDSDGSNGSDEIDLHSIYK